MGKTFAETVDFAWEDFLHDYLESEWSTTALNELNKTRAEMVSMQAAIKELTDTLHEGGKFDFLVDAMEVASIQMDGVATALRGAVEKVDRCHTAVELVDNVIGESLPSDGVKDQDAKAYEDALNECKAKWLGAISKARATRDELVTESSKVAIACNGAAATIVSEVRSAVRRAVAQKNAKGAHAAIGWITTLGATAIAIVQVADAEPLSALAAEGVHALLKGIGDLGKEIATQISKEDFDTALGQLEDLDIARSRVADMKTVVSWLLEPLGLIPTVGSLVRGGVQTFINVGLDSTIQAAELKLKEAEKPEEVETIGDSFGANVFEGLVEYVQDALKAAPKELVELFKDGKEPADLAAAAAELIGGAALKAILARVVKPAQTVSKEDVTGLMDGLKDVQKQMVDQMLRTPGGEAPIGFDELAARMTSTTHLDGIAIDVPDVAYVATPPDGASVVLIGGQNAGHTPSNLLFVKGLIDRGLGYEGTFVKRKHSITHPHGQLEFNFPGDVEEIVTTYIEQYGSGSGRITKKDLKFV